MRGPDLLLTQNIALWEQLHNNLLPFQQEKGFQVKNAKNYVTLT